MRAGFRMYLCVVLIQGFILFMGGTAYGKSPGTLGDAGSYYDVLRGLPLYFVENTGQVDIRARYYVVVCQPPNW